MHLPLKTGALHYNYFVKDLNQKLIKKLYFREEDKNQLFFGLCKLINNNNEL